jgi:hypothetical protein
MFQKLVGVEPNTIVESESIIVQESQTIELLGSGFSFLVNGTVETSPISVDVGDSIKISVTSSEVPDKAVYCVFSVNGTIETFTVVSEAPSESVHFDEYKDIEPFSFTLNNDGSQFVPDSSKNQIVVYDQLPSNTQKSLVDEDFSVPPDYGNGGPGGGGGTTIIPKSLYLDGNDGLNTTLSSSIGTSDFTLEFWIKFDSLYNYITPFSLSPRGGQSFEIGLWADGTVTYYIGGDRFRTSSGVAKVNIWQHFALVRNSGVATMYVDGVARASAGSTDNFTSTDVGIGYARAINGQFVTGYMTNLRLVKDFAIYTSNFSIPTEPLGAVGDTLLLTANDSVIDDDSTYNHILTSVGDPEVSDVVPFEVIDNSSKSLYFDGNRDYVSIPSSSDFAFGTSDFNIEFWMNRDSIMDPYPRLVHFGPTWGSNDSVALIILNYGSTPYIGFSSYKLANPVVISSTVPTPGSWYHIAVTRKNGVFRLFINGNLESENSNFIGQSVESSLTNTCYLGSASSELSGEDYKGYLSNVRIIKGTAIYTSDFSVPTEPLTAIDGTVLLTANDSTINDDSASNHTLTVFGDTSVSSEVPGFVDPIDPIDPIEYDDDTVLVPSYHTGKLYRIDQLTSQPGSFIDTGAKPYRAVIVRSDPSDELSQQIWVTCSDINEIQVYNFYTSELVTSIPTSARPTGITVSTDYQKIAVACNNSSEVIVFNWSGTAFVETTVSITGNPIELTIDHNNDIYGICSDTNEYFKIDANDNVTYHLTGQKPRDIAYFPDFGKSSFGFTENEIRGSIQFTSPAYIQSISERYVFRDDDFSFDFWFKPTSLPGGSYYHTFFDMRIGGTGIAFGMAPGGYVGSYQLSVGEWYHICLARQSGTIKTFVNGTVVDSSENNVDYTAQTIRIAGVYNSPNIPWQLYGFISNFRISNGSAIFFDEFRPVAYESLITENTVLLTATGDGFNDISSYNHDLVPNFSPQESLTEIPIYSGSGNGEVVGSINITSSLEDKIYTHELDGTIRWSKDTGGFYPYRINRV